MEQNKNITEEHACLISGSSGLCDTTVAIIGAGVAGMYAAHCCHLTNIDCVIVDELLTLGGQCEALYPNKIIYGVPGYDGITARSFINKLTAQCITEDITKFVGYKVDRITKNQCFEIHAKNVCNQRNEIIIRCKYLILATGIGEMKPNIPKDIRGITDSSISSGFIQFYCLNHTIYRNKDVIIAGGGDSAVDFAIDISSIANSVAIIHRRDTFSCDEHKISILSNLSEKINIIMSQKITEIECERHIIHTIDDKSDKHLYKCDHIVFCYGFVANSENLFQILGIETEKNLVKINIDDMTTSLDNCYAIGDAVTYKNKKKNIIPCFFEADRAVRMIKTKISGE